MSDILCDGLLDEDVPLVLFVSPEESYPLMSHYYHYWCTYSLPSYVMMLC